MLTRAQLCDFASRLRFLGVGYYIMTDILLDLAREEDPAFVAAIVERSNKQGYNPEKDDYPWTAADLGE